MSEIKATGYTVSPHAAHFGNVAKQHVHHKFSAEGTDGKIIRLMQQGFEKTYFSVQIASSGLGPGVTFDIGYRGLESCEDHPEFFVKGYTGAATKSDVIVPTFRRMIDDGVKRCDCDDAEAASCGAVWGEMHELILTMHGDAAEGACLDLVFEYEHNRTN